jgi:serine/threonine protein kinase
VFQPTTFGNYFLTKRLAVGGMAEVFAAKLYGADGFEKDIVIKQILPQYARDPEFVQSFVAEAKIAVTLSHANIVGIYELGRVGGTYFIAMELVDGLDVFTLIDVAKRAGRPISTGMAAYIVEEVAKGLDYAHRKVGPDGQPLGLVHRDLSPRNVLISREGDVKILDFGIAKTRSELAAMPKTRAGVVKGTSGYMSPEQATGGEVDARTDVYQAGLLLYELLTGQALFWRPDDEETRELMRRHQIILPSLSNTRVEAELDQLVQATLTRDPSRRIQTAHELVTQLSRFRLVIHPEVGARPLGELVSALMVRSEEEDEAAGMALPSTQELKSSLAEILTPEARARVETIATRAPSGSGRRSLTDAMTQAALAHQAAMAANAAMNLRGGLLVEGTLGSHGGYPAQSPFVPTSSPPVLPRAPSGSSGVAIPSPPSPPPATAEPSPLLTGSNGQAQAAPVLASQILPLKPPFSRGKQAALFAVIGLSLAGAAAGISVALPTRPTPERIEVRTVPPHVEPPPLKDPTPAAPQEEIAPPKLEPVPVKQAKRETRLISTKVAKNDPPAQGFATVAFGTHSCSSRVSVDGVVVARSTPFYDYKLAAGAHAVLIEGTSCPPVERPGSLKSSIPTVSGQVKVEAGAALKIIADFEHGTIAVRPK